MTHVEFDRYANAPDRADRRHELLDGRVLEFPLHEPAHGLVCGNAAWVIGEYARRTGFGQVVAGAGVLLARDPDTVLGPDVSLFAVKRPLAALLARAARPGYDDTPPTLAAEALCPEDQPAVVARKVDRLLAAGVKCVWLLDPAARTLVVHAPGADPRPLTESDGLTGEPDLPGFACGVAEFFAA